MDRGLWNHVNKLERICLSNELYTRINSIHVYNGVTDINRKYKLGISFFKKDEKVFTDDLSIYDSISKEKHIDTFHFFDFNTNDTLHLKGNFECE